MQSKTEILTRLAECRLNYPLISNEEEKNLFLENTMLAIQDLLFFEKFEWSKI